MILLVSFLFLALGVSFLCSILESVLLSLTPSFVAAFEKRYPKLGSDLSIFKKDIDRPLVAILSLNTVSHTVGAAGVGAQAMVVFGELYVAVISVILTLLILIVSEIIPKTLGALYWRELTPYTIRIMKVLIFLLYPLVIVSQKIMTILTKRRKVISITREEISSIADVGYKEGSLLKQESIILNNLMHFGILKVQDIMTPRPFIFSLSADLTIKDVFENYPQLRFSRIPIYYESHENISYYVLKNDILLSFSNNEADIKLDDLKRKLLIVPEIVSIYKAFDQILESRASIALAVDEYGGVAGIVTLEDIVETLIGIEIIDESDIAKDMQKLARNQWIKRAKRLGIISDSDELEEWLKK
jgi:CBS domain containing-hemolysin-like protein